MCFLVLAVLQLIPESCGCCVVACRTSLSCTHPGSPAEAKPQAGGLQGAPWLHASDLTELLETKPGSEQPALHLQGERKAVACQKQVAEALFGKDAANCGEARRSSSGLVPSRQLLFNTAEARSYCRTSVLNNLRGSGHIWRAAHPFVFGLLPAKT